MIRDVRDSIFFFVILSSYVVRRNRSQRHCCTVQRHIMIWYRYKCYSAAAWAKGACVPLRLLFYGHAVVFFCPSHSRKKRTENRAIRVYKKETILAHREACRFGLNRNPIDTNSVLKSKYRIMGCRS